MTSLQILLDEDCTRWIENKRAHGVSPTSHVRAALTVHQHLEALMADGARIVVEHPDGRREELRFL